MLCRNCAALRLVTAYEDSGYSRTSSATHWPKEALLPVSSCSNRPGVANLLLKQQARMGRDRSQRLPTRQRIGEDFFVGGFQNATSRDAPSQSS